MTAAPLPVADDEDTAPVRYEPPKDTNYDAAMVAAFWKLNDHKPENDNGI